MIKKLYIALSLAFITLLSACSGQGPGQSASTGIKLGRPYMIDGRVYSPTYNPRYDETGIASWYGPGFHGNRTATGERYDQNEITAAHKTLPLPCIVRVTNLDNGRSTVVRVNDRGPFVGDRVIDLSKGAATQLGMLNRGTARVRVQFLDQETRQYVSNMPNGAESLKKLDTFAKAGDGRAFNPNDIMVSDVAPVPASATVASNDKIPAPVVATKPLPFASPAYPGQKPRQVAAVALQEAPVKPVSYVTPVNPTAPRVEKDSRPVTTAAATPSFEDTAKAVARGYFIQAGTFGVKDNAERMLTALSEIGNAKIVETMLREKKFYRVLAGPFNSRSDAENILSRLDTAGISGAKIIRN